MIIRVKMCIIFLAAIHAPKDGRSKGADTTNDGEDRGVEPVVSGGLESD